MTHRFRFGVGLKTATDAADFRATCKHVEDVGYSWLTLADHLDDRMGPIAAVMAAAAATTSIRVGTRVLANDFRHPVVLAKELATVDVLSGGRLDIGVGAGWRRSEYEQAGLPYDTPGTRIDRLVESIAIIKGLMGDGPFSFDGGHYKVTKLDGLPKPAQRPHPPIYMGGGRKRMLSVAGRHADIVGINYDTSEGFMGPRAMADLHSESTAAKVAWVREAAGDRFPELVLQTHLFEVVVARDRVTAAAEIGRRWRLPTETVLDSPVFLIGDPDFMCEEIERRRERFGISLLTMGVEALDRFAPVVYQLTGK